MDSAPILFASNATRADILPGTAGWRMTAMSGEDHHKADHALTSRQTNSLCHKEPSDRRGQQWLKYRYVKSLWESSWRMPSGHSTTGWSRCALPSGLRIWSIHNYRRIFQQTLSPSRRNTFAYWQLVETYSSKWTRDSICQIPRTGHWSLGSHDPMKRNFSCKESSKSRRQAT